MLAEIGSVDKIPEFIAKVKDKNSEVRLMGFGHRVYKNYDPRAKIMTLGSPKHLRNLLARMVPVFGGPDDMLRGQPVPR